MAYTVKELAQITLIKRDLIAVCNKYRMHEEAAGIKKNFTIHTQNITSYPLPPIFIANIPDTLEEAFFWKNTPEGHDYWRQVHIKLHQYIGAEEI